MTQVFALTFEYSYANNNDGDPSPDEAGGILGLFEDEDDANGALKAAQESGDWGDFSDEEENCGWSSGGYILAVESHEVVPASKR
jgi:hypothetical protein